MSDRPDGEGGDEARAEERGRAAQERHADDLRRLNEQRPAMGSGRFGGR